MAFSGVVRCLVSRRQTAPQFRRLPGGQSANPPDGAQPKAEKFIAKAKPGAIRTSF